MPSPHHLISRISPLFGEREPSKIESVRAQKLIGNCEKITINYPWKDPLGFVMVEDIRDTAAPEEPACQRTIDLVDKQQISRGIERMSCTMLTNSLFLWGVLLVSNEYSPTPPRALTNLLHSYHSIRTSGTISLPFNTARSATYPSHGPYCLDQ
jgi:hypothetical protein